MNLICNQVIHPRYQRANRHQSHEFSRTPVALKIRRSDRPQADAAQKLNLVYSNAITLRTGPLGQPLGQQEMAAPGVEGERHEQPDAGGVGMTVPVLRKSVALSWAEAGAPRTLEPPPMHYEPHFQRDIPEGRKRQPGG